MKENSESVALPCCRTCPSGDFDLSFLQKAAFSASRYIAICHAKEIVLQPEFTDEQIRESLAISRANVQTVRFTPVDNCPHIEKLRKEGKIPWASSSIDFLGLK